jgi:hypothetical protein
VRSSRRSRRTARMVSSSSPRASLMVIDQGSPPWLAT